MKRRLLSLLVALIFSTIIIASPVTVDVARSVATNWYKHYATNGIKDFSVKNVFVTKNQDLITFYTFNFNAGGFVMIAADDISYPLLGYSYESDYNENTLPPNAAAFFNDYSREIALIVNAKLDNKETRKEWDNLINDVYAKDINAVPAMCTTNWDQGSPYNAQCPNGDPTGCVATAMAQIMKKWNYPTTGAGTHSYTPGTHPEYGVLTANFGATTYNWAGMSSAAGTATLMSHCGISVNMDYDAAGSGAYISDVPNSLINYFKYQPTAEVKYQSLFPVETNWTAMIKAEMDAGRPVLLAGSSTASGGHAFVCDGYNTANKYHINWGWGGMSNGNFFLNALNPSGSNFSTDRQAVVRIQPLSSVMPIADFTVDNTIPAIGQGVSFIDISQQGPITAWSWTFDGGTPSVSTLQNPTGITFATNGYHIVSLKVTNASGVDTKVAERYVKVGGVPSAWIKQNSGFNNASRGIDQIFIVDQNTVWAKAYDGGNPTGYIREFTRTNNGGTTWTPGTISFTNSANYGVANIFPLDYNTAYACMFPVTGTGGAIVKTTDGGVTWAIQTSAPFTGSWADFVHFFNANDGVCMGDPATTDFFVYTTSNGGATWTQVPVGNIPNSQTSEAGIVNLYDAVDNTIWFSTNKGRVFKSTDKGLTWNVYTTGFTNTFTMKFKNASAGTAVLDTLPYTMKKTNDGGLTWATLTPTGYYVKYPRIAFVPGTTSTWINAAASPNQGSSYSLNDCVSFQNIDTGSVQYLSLAFYDINTGWAGSFNASSVDGGIYKWNPALITDISKVRNDDSFTVYPVPAHNLLNVNIGKTETDMMTVSIFDMIGRCVYSKHEKAVSGDIFQIDVSDKGAGVYFMSIQNGNKTTTKKFTIVK